MDSEIFQVVYYKSVSLLSDEKHIFSGMKKIMLIFSLIYCIAAKVAALQTGFL